MTIQKGAVPRAWEHWEHKTYREGGKYGPSLVLDLELCYHAGFINGLFADSDPAIDLWELRPPAGAAIEARAHYKKWFNANQHRLPINRDAFEAGYAAGIDYWYHRASREAIRRLFHEDTDPT